MDQRQSSQRKRTQYDVPKIFHSLYDENEAHYVREEEEVRSSMRERGKKSVHKKKKHDVEKRNMYERRARMKQKRQAAPTVRMRVLTR